MTRSLTTLLVVILATGMFSADALAVSQAGAISMTFPIGARFNALGEAGTAASTDITAMWWNPGGFAYAADNGYRRGLHFMDTKLVPDLADDVRLDHIAYGQYIEGWGMMGAYVTYLSNGEQQNTNEAGTLLGTFNSYEFAVGATYGAKLSPQLGVGVGVKYFRNELAPDEVTQDRGPGTGSTWAVDFGVHYRVNSRIWTGLTVANLGPDITFIDADQSDPMPRTLRFGTAYTPYVSELTSFLVVADYLISLVPEDETKVLGLGVEWSYLNSLFLRAGYKNDKEGDIVDATFGGGVDLKRWTGQALIVDYANVPQASDLSRVHRISVAFQF